MVYWSRLEPDRARCLQDGTTLCVHKEDKLKIPSWKISWTFMTFHESWWKQDRFTRLFCAFFLVKYDETWGTFHEFWWTLMYFESFSWNCLSSSWWILMNNIILQKCIILTWRIFMKCHENSSKWLIVNHCEWSSRLGIYHSNELGECSQFMTQIQRWGHWSVRLVKKMIPPQKRWTEF